MKITQIEQLEIDQLRAARKSSTGFMSQEQQDRLDALNKKYWHNACSNPHCIGYEGKDTETICPNCGSALFKLI